MTTTAIKPVPGNFTLIATLLIAGLIFFGFSFTIWPDLLARARPAVLYGHAATAAGWLALLVAQVALVRRGRVALHRRIGPYGLWLGAAASATSFVAALILRHESVVNHPGVRTVERIAFLAVPLAGFVAFTVALTLAARWRRQPAFHRRAMMLAAVSLMGAGIARIPVLGDQLFSGDIAQALTILVLAAHDYRTMGRVHPVYLAGLPLFVGLSAVTDYLFLEHPDWWVATARSMIGV